MSSSTINEYPLVLAHVNLPDVDRLDMAICRREASGVLRVLTNEDTSVTNVELSPVPAPEDPLESLDASFPPPASIFFTFFLSSFDPAVLPFWSSLLAFFPPFPLGLPFPCFPELFPSPRPDPLP